MSPYERLWARIATYSAETGKKFVIMDRTAWGERTAVPFRGDNEVDFMGRLVAGKAPEETDDNLVKVGFFHPLFAGAVTPGAVVEVIDNHSQYAPFRYYAKGTGIRRFIAAPACYQYTEPPENPCEIAECVHPVIWAWGNAGDPSDPDTMMTYWDVEGGGLPARFQLPSDFLLRDYTGPNELPLPYRGMIVDWNPGRSAFMLDFQMCHQAPRSNGSLEGPSDGTHVCCYIYWALQGLFGDALQEFYESSDYFLQLCEDYWNGFIYDGLGNPPGEEPPPEE